MAPEKFVLNLAGKSPDDVVAELTEAGFDVSSGDATMLLGLENIDSAPDADEPEHQQVTVVWINEAQASSLTAIVYDDPTIMQPGFDLYFHHDMDGAVALSSGQWSVIKILK